MEFAWRVREVAHKHTPLGSPEWFWGSKPWPSELQCGHPKLMLRCVSEGGLALYPQLRVDHGGGDWPEKRPRAKGWIVLIFKIGARGWRLLLCLPLDRVRCVFHCSCGGSQLSSEQLGPRSFWWRRLLMARV